MAHDVLALNAKGIVWDHWRRHAESTPDREAIVHWVTGEAPHRWTWADLIRTASLFAERLREEGVRKGDVCAIIIRHNRLFYPIYIAISSMGALPAVLAYPNPRLHPEKFRQGLSGMAQRSGLDWLLTERELDDMIRPLLKQGGSTVRNVFFPLEWVSEARKFQSPPHHPEVLSSEPCLLQHSSGTTGLQKAVVLSHRAILEHVSRLGDFLRIRTDDRIVSWLPLYHDMGLIAAFYLPLISGVPVVQIDPFEWVIAPAIFLETVSAEGGTLAWLPNFAYNLMADRVRDEDIEGIRLDSLRMLINCSEPVRAESHEKFFRRFARFGFRRVAFAASYGMAETTFAVTQTPPDVEAKRLPLLREGIAREVGEISSEVGENVRVCVSSGVPISGCELRVVDETGIPVPDLRVGEILIRSVSLFDGYRNSPEKTAEVLKDGWYQSGDFGFRHEGELYVIGRKKDLIIVAGKNIYPEDIEDAVGQVKGILPGRVIAFGLEDAEHGTDQICVVAETNAVEEEGRKALRRDVVEAGMAVDVTISRVYLAPPRWLIKSSAGKPSRKANRDRAVVELDWMGIHG